MSAMGCKATPKRAASAASDIPRRPVLLSVPDRSRTSPLPQKPTDRGQTKRRPVRSKTLGS
ncbi:hypothetical protein F4W70_07505 [Pseudomonas cannabina]|nr:hypothetical protein F4W70_07505 [Pseudomonas cannabina]